MLKQQDYFHVVQPIMDLTTNAPFGFEVLLRSKRGISPLEMFCNAREENLLVDLDIISIIGILEKYVFLLEKVPVFVNVFPSTLLSPKFDRVLTMIAKLKITNLVFELNESNDDRDVWRNELLYERVELLKSLQVGIAIDDVGAGQSTLQNIVKLQPHYIKLDKFFADNLIHSKEKQQIITSFIDISKSFQSYLVLEGIETLEHYQTALSLDVPFVQGFFFGQPFEIFENQVVNL